MRRGKLIAIFPDGQRGESQGSFHLVRKILHGRPGVHILYPARFHVSCNNVEKEFVEAAMDYVKEIILSSAGGDDDGLIYWTEVEVTRSSLCQ